MFYVQNVIDRNFKKGHELRMYANRVLELCHKNSNVFSTKEFDAFQLSRELYNDFLFFSFREHYQNLDTCEVTVDEVNRGMRSAINDLKIKVDSLKDFFDFIWIKLQENTDETKLTLSLIQGRVDKTVEHG
jgi:hypothetical protein